MTIRNILPLLLLFSFIFTMQLHPSSSIEKKADEYLAFYVAKDQFSGTVLIAQGDDILLSKGYGYANREVGVPNSPEMKFRLGSITKQFTAMLIMQLYERGEIGIHDPLSAYLDDFPEGDKITIHHLLSHTSGIPNFTSFPDYSKTMMIPATLEELIDRFRDKPLEFEPGSTYSYSNSGYILLGYIIEHVTKIPYADVVREYIFDVVGMPDSGYDDPRKIIGNRAAGYEFDGNRVLNASYIDMSIPHAAGALFSTVEDLYKWDRILYTDCVFKTV
jgi:CubicO group peptidase (beta-lactamase class C family)